MSNWWRRRELLARSRWVGLFACALAFALVLLRLDAKSLWWDESLSLLRAQSDLATILAGRISFGGLDTTDQHPPLYFMTLALFRTLMGESDFALRLPSALSMVGIVAVTFALARRLFGGRVASLSALFAALSPLLIWYGQEARMYTLATLLCLVSVYAAWRALTERSWFWAFGAVAALAAAAGTHYLTLLFTVTADAIIVVLQRWQARGSRARQAVQLHSAWRFALIAFTTVIVALAVVFAILRRLPAGDVYENPPLSLGGMLVDAFNSYSLGLSVSLRHVWWIDVIFAAAWLGGLGAVLAPALRRQARSARLGRLALLAAAPLIPIGIVWLLSRRLSFYINSRYVMFSVPLFAISLGCALTVRRWRALRYLLALGFVLAMGWSLQRYYCNSHYASKEEYAGAANYVMSRELSGDLLIVNGPESEAAFAHYYQGRLPLVSFPEAGMLATLDTRLPQLTQGYERVWLVRARRAFTDPDEAVVEWFEGHTTPELTRTFESWGALVSVSLYTTEDPFGTATGAAADAQAQIGPALLLTAARITDQTVAPWAITPASQATIGVASGASIAARLTWVLASPTPDLKLSLRLVREGLVWAQRDLRPIEQEPSAEWAPQARVTHTASLPIPRGLPPALYELQVWAYDGQTGESWPVIWPDGSSSPYLPLGQVAVQAPDRVPPAWRAPLATAWAPRWGGLGQAVVLEETKGLPEQATPGQSLAIGLSWHRQQPENADLKVVLTWRASDGSESTAATYSLLGPGALDASAATLNAIETLAPVTAPTAPGKYALHLTVHDRSNDRYLWVRRGLLPLFSRDLRLGTMTVQP